MDEDVFDEFKLFSTFDSVENGDESATAYSRARSESGSVSQLDALKQENVLLKKLLCKIGGNPSEDKPFANVLFYKNARSKQGDFEDFICDQTRRSAQNNIEIVCDESGLPSSGKRNILNDGFAAALGQISDNTKLDDKDLSDLPITCVQYFASFCVDRFGSDMEKIFPKPPNYDRVYFKTLPEETGSKVSQRRKKVCFNCDGDHTLNDCPKRRDFARINMKRREFMENKTFTNESRYHEDQMKCEQYQHIKPGVISSKLREALNLSEHDLPPFIYRMRMIGYPPDWVPSNNDSGIVVYGAEGEEEESNENNHEGHDKYVRYPGFNVPMPQECQDLAYVVHLPHMQHQYQLNIKPEDDLSVKENNKRKLSSDEESHHQSKKMKSYTESDMDVDDEEPPGTSGIIQTGVPDSEDNTQTKILSVSKSGELEDGEIADSPEGSDVINQQPWWLKEPLVAHFKTGGQEFMPPPFPLTPLPLHKISQILPGELNHISFEDRSRWLDPVFGNLQVRTGRFEKLKTILATRENKRKSL